MTKYSILKRLSYMPFFGGSKPENPLEHSPVFPFDDVEVETLNKVWDGAWISTAHHDKKGVHLITQDGGHVHIQRDKITVSANAEEATLRSLVLHAKENWNGTLSPGANNSNVEQLARVWAHCQVHGVNFSWEPPPQMAAQLKTMVEQLNYQERRIETTGSYPAYGADGLTYRPPVFGAVQIPGAGSRPNHSGLKAGSLAAQIGTDAAPRPSRGLNGIAEQATENARLEREAFVRARNAGKISINDIDDWGLRIRMIACDRADQRMKLAQIKRRLPPKPPLRGMHL